METRFSSIIEDLKFIGSETKVNVDLIYAFNGTGKTRLSSNFYQSATKECVLLYNAFTEDVFHWDNDTLTLKMDTNSWIFNLILDNTLDTYIEELFNNFIRNDLNVYFDFTTGGIEFTKKDDEKNIKISKGEESLFIFSVFITIVDEILDILSEKEKQDRISNDFDDVKYIFIDDPVSSLDDNHIIALAVQIVNLLKKFDLSGMGIKIIITTHHTLFYSSLKELMKTKEFNLKCKVLKRQDDSEIVLENQDSSHFLYHLYMIEEIRNALNSNSIKKYHIASFRALLEKVQSFFGLKHWSLLLPEQYRDEAARMFNNFSHSKLNDMEYNNINERDLEVFDICFCDFEEKFFKYQPK